MRATRTCQQKNARGDEFYGERDMKPKALADFVTMTPDRARAVYPPANRLVTSEWLDPDDTNPLRRTQRAIKGKRRYSVIDALHRNKPHEITEAMRDAAARLSLDVEAAKCGFAMVANYDASTGRGSVWAGKPADRAVAAIDRVRAAGVALAGVGDVVVWVVGGNGTLKDWARARVVSEAVAKGFLIAALSVLVAHYEAVDKNTACRRAKRPV